MIEDELELAILEMFVAHHKEVETANQGVTDKCARELDMRNVLQELTDEEDVKLEYEANLWIGRLQSTEHQAY